MGITWVQRMVERNGGPRLGPNRNPARGADFSRFFPPHEVIYWRVSVMPMPLSGPKKMLTILLTEDGEGRVERLLRSLEAGVPGLFLSVLRVARTPMMGGQP